MALLAGTKATLQKNTDEINYEKYGSFFHKGVLAENPSLKGDQIHVRLLPSFDYENTSKVDEAFKTSWIPYRDMESEDVDPVTETPAFTSWFVPVMGYTFFGRGTKSFISPLTLEEFYPEGKDPIRDVYKYIDTHRTSAELVNLIEGEPYINDYGKESRKNPYIKKSPREFVLMNALVYNKQEGNWVNKVLRITRSAFNEFLKVLSLKTGLKDEIVADNEFSEYLFNDVLNPEIGCAVHSRPISVGTGGFQTVGLWVSADNKTLKGYKKHPVTAEELAGRYDITDTDKVTKIATYQEILDYLVEDGVVPMDILEKACGKYGTINPHLRTETVSLSDVDKKNQDTQPTAKRNISGGTLQRGNTNQSTSAFGLPKPPPQGTQPTSQEEDEDDIPYTPAKPTPVSTPASNSTSSEAAEKAELENKITSGTATGEEVNRYVALTQAGY